MNKLNKLTVDNKKLQNELNKLENATNTLLSEIEAFDADFETYKANQAIIKEMQNKFSNYTVKTILDK